MTLKKGVHFAPLFILLIGQKFSPLPLSIFLLYFWALRADLAIG